MLYFHCIFSEIKSYQLFNLTRKVQIKIRITPVYQIQMPVLLNYFHQFRYPSSQRCLYGTARLLFCQIRLSATRLFSPNNKRFPAERLFEPAHIYYKIENSIQYFYLLQKSTILVFEMFKKRM